MFQFHSLYVTFKQDYLYSIHFHPFPFLYFKISNQGYLIPTFKQDYLYSIHFHPFPFLYFKISNQGYLIPFHSILFHSFPLLKYISFYSIPFHSLITPKRSLKVDHGPPSSLMLVPLYSIYD